MSAKIQDAATARPHCTLSPAVTPTVDTLCIGFAEDLKPPGRFGRNPDALYDCLSGDVDGPFAVTVHQPGRLCDRLGDFRDAVAVLLLDVVTERDDASVSSLNDWDLATMSAVNQLPATESSTRCV